VGRSACFWRRRGRPDARAICLWVDCGLAVEDRRSAEDVGVARSSGTGRRTFALSIRLRSLRLASVVAPPALAIIQQRPAQCASLLRLSPSLLLVLNEPLSVADAAFDHVLSHCTSLRELTIQFAYTGPTLLDSLRSCPLLQSLVFLGTPVSTSATDLANRLENRVEQFGKLERLVVSGQYYGRGAVPGGGWVGADVRRIKTVCKAKGIFCLFSAA
jgi:hypothetical protein